MTNQIIIKAPVPCYHCTRTSMRKNLTEEEKLLIDEFEKNVTKLSPREDLLRSEKKRQRAYIVRKFYFLRLSPLLQSKVACLAPFYKKFL